MTIEVKINATNGDHLRALLAQMLGAKTVETFGRMERTGLQSVPMNTPQPSHKGVDTAPEPAGDAAGAVEPAKDTAAPAATETTEAAAPKRRGRPANPKPAAESASPPAEAGPEPQAPKSPQAPAAPLDYDTFKKQMHEAVTTSSAEDGGVAAIGALAMRDLSGIKAARELDDAARAEILADTKALLADAATMKALSEAPNPAACAEIAKKFLGR